MQIIDDLIPKGKYNRPGTKSIPKRICVHYTGECGTAAARFALCFTTNPNAKTSSQYIVGIDGEIIRCVPDDEISYAAAGKNNGTIHIECCYKDSTGKFEEATIIALSELVLYLMDKHKISAKNVVRHYDLTGKHCPMYYVDAMRWAALHERITTKPSDKKLYRVQVGAFSNKENAENYATAIRKAGFGALVVRADKLYRVQVGAFSSKEYAHNYAKTLKASGYSTIIVEAK